MHGIAPPQVQDVALPIVRLHEDPISLFPSSLLRSFWMAACPKVDLSPSRTDCIYPVGWIEEKMFLFLYHTIVFISGV